MARWSAFSRREAFVDPPARRAGFKAIVHTSWRARCVSHRKAQVLRRRDRKSQLALERSNFRRAVDRARPLHSESPAMTSSLAFIFRNNVPDRRVSRRHGGTQGPLEARFP